MKRILAIAAISLAALFCTSEISAQRLGVTAGANFTSMQNIDKSSATGYAVGLTSQFKLPLGFSIQPSLLYSAKVSEVGDNALTTFKMNVGYLELPVSVQWGPDLLVARPFLDVTPYVGYSLTNKVKSDFAGIEEVVKGGNGLDYGLGLGAGINVWKLQAIVRYNWNFGVLGNYKDFTGVDLGDIKTDSETFGGITVNLAYFF